MSSSAASREDREKTARRKVEALVEKASSLEASGDYAGAVDAYFEVHRKAFGASPSADEKATMIKAWRAAVKLAGERVPGKTRAVVSEAAHRIRKLGDAAAADDLLAVHGVSPAEARERYAPGAAAAGAAVGKKAAASSEADTLAVSEKASSAASASSEADAPRRAAHAARSGDGATGASTLAALPRGPPVDAEQFGVYEASRRRRWRSRWRRATPTTRWRPPPTPRRTSRDWWIRCAPPRRARGRAARVPGFAGSRASDA